VTLNGNTLNIKADEDVVDLNSMLLMILSCSSFYKGVKSSVEN
jgi:hypothetical protein